VEEVAAARDAWINRCFDVLVYVCCVLTCLCMYVLCVCMFV